MRPSRERLLELFDVDLEAGRLFWKQPPRNHPSLSGAEAGVATLNRWKLYWIVKVDGVQLRRGRIIFFLKHGRWPTPQCDHKNGNSVDDRWRNLRSATVQQNAMNHRGRAKKSDLPMGVRLTRHGNFVARVGFKGKKLHVGTFKTIQDAERAYLAKRKELFGEWAFNS